MSPYWVMMGLILVLTPIICWVFTLGREHTRTPLGKVAQVIHDKRYYLHAIGYIIIIKWKSITDNLNEPIKVRTGNWTEWVYSLEGDATLWIQQAFENVWLTEFLNFHYLFIYLFLIYITTVYFAYVGERDLTDKVTLNYLLIYALAVPYYLFFNVEVTSSWIPGMKALLYHDGWYSVFYATHDPLDNAVPSLHVAIPFGIILLNWLHCKEKGIKMRNWTHWPYHLFIVVNTFLFIFTIAYLGIHWLIDIPLGLVIGGIGALFIHHLQPRLRNDKGSMFKGVTKKKVVNHTFWEGAVTIFLLFLVLSAVNYQESNVDERVSFRLGGGENSFEILAEIDNGEQIISTITNYHSTENLEFVAVAVDASVPAMNEGIIDWEVAKQLGTVQLVSPGGSENYIHTDEHAKQWWLIIFHNPSNDSEEVMEIKVLNDYGEDVMWQAVALSLPSLWMTGFVFHRLKRLKMAGRSYIDSTPSHLWEEE